MTLRAILWRLLLIKLGIADWRHRRCLAQIAALERELFPPPMLVRGGELTIAPGTVWPVEYPDGVVVTTEFTKAGLARSAAAYKAGVERARLAGASPDAAA